MSTPAAGLTLLGVPFDANSSYLRGPAKAPAKIREALFSDSSNLWTEAGVDLGAPSVLHDAGDLRLPEQAEPAFAAIESAVRDQLARDARLLFLGGDHSITFPLVRAIAAKFSPLTILHFDAHPDLYDEFEGNRYSHACPFARIMEQGLASRLVQVGIRTMNRRQREQAERFGVEVHELKGGGSLADIALRGPVYVSFDLDVLDSRVCSRRLALGAGRILGAGSHFAHPGHPGAAGRRGLGGVQPGPRCFRAHGHGGGENRQGTRLQVAGLTPILAHPEGKYSRLSDLCGAAARGCGSNQAAHGPPAIQNGRGWDR
jgi:hypothetical protein